MLALRGQSLSLIVTRKPESVLSFCLWFDIEVKNGRKIDLKGEGITIKITIKDRDWSVSLEQ